MENFIFCAATIFGNPRNVLEEIEENASILLTKFVRINVNRIIIEQIKIYLIRNKFEMLSSTITIYAHNIHGNQYTHVIHNNQYTHGIVN